MVFPFFTHTHTMFMHQSALSLPNHYQCYCLVS